VLLLLDGRVYSFENGQIPVVCLATYIYTYDTGKSIIAMKRWAGALLLSNQSVNFDWGLQ